MLNKIHLHGSLEKFGKSHELSILTAGEAVVALSTICPGFSQEIRRGSWTLMRGDRETGLALDEEMIREMRLGDADLHILPGVMGAKNGDGAIKTILGAALIVASGGAAGFLAQPIAAGLSSGVTWGNAIGQMGAAMALTGASQLLAPQTDSENVDDKSFTFTGPTSRQGQGHAIQIVYGEVITGGMVISAGIDADGLASVTETATSQTNPDTAEADPENLGGASNV